LLGSHYCTAFVEEDTIRTECAEHEKYLNEYCIKKASVFDGKTEDSTCATKARVNRLYCPLLVAKLAGNKAFSGSCMFESGFMASYCGEIKYDNAGCLSIKPGALLAEEVSTGRAEKTTVDNVESFKALVRDGDTKSMDVRLPTGWRSGWDNSYERFFFFPVEKVDGSWDSVPGVAPVWEQPTKPWEVSKHSSNKAAAVLDQGNIPDKLRLKHHAYHRQHRKKTRHARHNKLAKTFGMRAGANLWKAYKKEHKRLHPLKSTDDKEAAMSAVEQDAVQIDGGRPPVLVPQEDGTFDFAGTRPGQ